MARLTNAKMIKAIGESRGLVAVAARKLGCSRKAIYNRMKKSPEIREALEEARELTTDTAEAALFRAIQEGQAWAVCFYLKTQGRARGYVEKIQHEHAGKDGGPIEMHQVSDDELRRRALELTNRLARLAPDDVVSGNGRQNGRPR